MEQIFLYPRRTDDGDNDGRRLFWQAVDQGNVQSLLFDLNIREYWLCDDGEIYGTSCERAACFCKRPGLAKAKALGLVPLSGISKNYDWDRRVAANSLNVSSSLSSSGEADSPDPP